MGGLAVSPLPVIGAPGAVLHGCVIFVTNQPEEFGVSPQPDVLPLLLGNIATPSIEVPHEDKVLEGRRVSKCNHEYDFPKEDQ